MRKAASNIKTLALTILLGLESYYLATIISNYVGSGNFFIPQIAFMVNVVILLLLISYTTTLTVGAWKTWQQYLVIPAPVAAGIFLGIFLLNFSQALTAALVVFLLLVLGVHVSTVVKSQMIKFNPVVVFRSAVRGLLLIFAALAAALVLMHSAGDPKMLNIGDAVGELAQEYSKDIISQPNFEELLNESLPTDLEVSHLLQQSDLPEPEVDVKTPVAENVNEMLEPYGIFVTPFIAVIIFAFVRFLGGISYVIYSITAWPLVTIFTKIGFLHKYEISAQKEEISFESSTK